MCVCVYIYIYIQAFQVALMVKNPPANEEDIRDMGLIYGSERSPGEDSLENTLQCSCLVKLMDRRAWQATVYRVTKSQTPLKLLSIYIYICIWLPWWLRQNKESACNAGLEFNPWVRKNPWKRAWKPTPVFLPREFHGQRSLAGYSPWGHIYI